MKPKAEDKKRREALVIVKKFNRILDTSRYYGLKNYEVFNRKIFFYLPNEWKKELTDKGKSEGFKEGIKEVIEDLEKEHHKGHFKSEDGCLTCIFIKKWKAKRGV